MAESKAEESAFDKRPGLFQLGINHSRITLKTIAPYGQCFKQLASVIYERSSIIYPL